MEEQKKNPAQGLSESEQVQVRRQKLADLQAAGNDPQRGFSFALPWLLLLSLQNG